ncbi:MAG: hypothetical protein ABSC32_15315 [Steroidobacteraceae bacterium]|jgi:hypothetical protein
MAAFSTFHSFQSGVGEILLRVRGAVCEALLFLWGLLVVAVLLLILGGFFL